MSTNKNKSNVPSSAPAKIRYSGKSHLFASLVELKEKAKKQTIAITDIVPLSKPFTRLPPAIQDGDVRLVKARSKFYVIAGFKSFTEQAKATDKIIAYVYTPRDMDSCAEAVPLDAEALPSAVAKLSSNPRFNVKVKNNVEA